MITGTQITKYQTIKQLIESPDMQKKNHLHYFYILKVPRCGGSRVKIGKSANIISRMKYYQSYFHSSEVALLELRSFPNRKAEYFGASAKKLYEVYEDEVKKALRQYSDETIQTGDGKITEWFKASTQKQLMDTYTEFVDKFRKLNIPKTEKKSLPSREVKKPINYKEKEESDIVSSRRNTADNTATERRRVPVQKFKP